MPLLGTPAGGDRPGRGPRALRRAARRGSGCKAPPYATAHSAEEALAAAPRRRLPAARAPELRARRARDGDRLLARRRSRDYLRARARRATAREIFLDRFLENAIEVDVDALCDGEDVWIGGDHAARRGGRRSTPATRPACCRRTRSAREMLERDRARRRAASRSRSACVGLINVQYARARRRPVRDRGQPARVADGAVRLQGDRPAAGQARLPGDARRAARATLDLPAEPGRRPRLGQGGGAAVRPLRRRRRAARPGDALDRRGDGRRRATSRPRSPRRRRRPARGCRTPAPCSSRSPTPTRPAAVGIAAQLHDLGFRDRRHARHRRGDRAHGHPGRAAQQDRRGLAARGRLDRARRRRPRHQHADRHRGARADGYEIRRAAVARGIPCITTMSGGDGGRARDRAPRATATPAVRLAAGAPRARGVGESAPA